MPPIQAQNKMELKTLKLELITQKFQLQVQTELYQMQTILVRTINEVNKTPNIVEDPLRVDL